MAQLGGYREKSPVTFQSSARAFAINGTMSVATDWPTARTPWLALDRNGNGEVERAGFRYVDESGVEKSGVIIDVHLRHLWSRERARAFSPRRAKLVGAPHTPFHTR